MMRGEGPSMSWYYWIYVTVCVSVCLSLQVFVFFMFTYIIYVNICVNISNISIYCIHIYICVCYHCFSRTIQGLVYWRVSKRTWRLRLKVYDFISLYLKIKNAQKFRKEIEENKRPWSNLCIKKAEEPTLGGGFKYFLFSPRTLGKIPILSHMFQLGWFNHHLEHSWSLKNVPFESTQNMRKTASTSR